ncbi:hypothetical protein [Tardiphaga sp.]|uniref:hypothetical protein n=1 Tax=Tardiphaga sp. TaxID=1926292 RepID=UPI00262FD0AC|nr:hypothetical protein [Tardiphaga sp.]MDB5620534.1 hypothetical protein [Tardiphaga sp.]
MADVARIIERVKACGANIMVDGSKLTVVNRSRLPAGAAEFIREHGWEIAAFLEREAAVDERAAIMEYDGGLNRPAAEYLTRLLMSSPPDGVDRSDWSWFVGQASQIIDRMPMERAA